MILNLNISSIAICRNSPAPVVSNLGLLTAPGSQSSASDTKPKIAAPASSNSATTNNTNSNTIKQPSLAAYALPAPSKGIHTKYFIKSIIISAFIVAKGACRLLTFFLFL